MATASVADDAAVANVKNNRERSVADLRRGPRRSDRATPKRFQLLTRAAAGAILLFASTALRPARSSHNPDPSRAGPEPWLGGSAPWCYNPWNSGYTAACTQGEPAEGAGSQRAPSGHAPGSQGAPRPGPPHMPRHQATVKTNPDMTSPTELNPDEADPDQADPESRPSPTTTHEQRSNPNPNPNPNLNPQPQHQP